MILWKVLRIVAISGFLDSSFVKFSSLFPSISVLHTFWNSLPTNYGLSFTTTLCYAHVGSIFRDIFLNAYLWTHKIKYFFDREFFKVRDFDNFFIFTRDSLLISYRNSTQVSQLVSNMEGINFLWSTTAYTAPSCFCVWLHLASSQLFSDSIC